MRPLHGVIIFSFSSSLILYEEVLVDTFAICPRLFSFGVRGLRSGPYNLIQVPFICLMVSPMLVTPMPIYIAVALPQADRGGYAAGIAFLLRIKISCLERFTLVTLKVQTFGTLVVLRDGTTSGDTTIDVQTSLPCTLMASTHLAECRVPGGLTI